MSKKRRKSRQVGIVPVWSPEPTNVVAFEKPAKPAVKYAVTQIPAQLLEAKSLFDEFAPFLQKGCDLSRGRYTPQWLWQMAFSDEMQIWAVLGGAKPAGAFATTTQLYPATGLHVLQVVILGGDGILAASDKIRDALEKFKAERGCHRVEWVGREGLERLWPGCERIGVACEVG